MISDSAPEDRVVSPYTGWSRVHWEDLADAQLTAAVTRRCSSSTSVAGISGSAGASSRCPQWAVRLSARHCAGCKPGRIMPGTSLEALANPNAEILKVPSRLRK